MKKVKRIVTFYRYKRGTKGIIYKIFDKGNTIITIKSAPRDIIARYMGSTGIRNGKKLNTVELQWLEHLWNCKNMLGIRVVGAS